MYVYKLIDFLIINFIIILYYPKLRRKKGLVLRSLYKIFILTTLRSERTQKLKEWIDSETSSIILDFLSIHLLRHYLLVLPGRYFAISVHLVVPCSIIYSASRLSSSIVHWPFLISGLSTFYHLKRQSSLDLDVR
jgi:hypothetical protein